MQGIKSFGNMESRIWNVSPTLCRKPNPEDGVNTDLRYVGNDQSDHFIRSHIPEDNNLHSHSFETPNLAISDFPFQMQPPPPLPPSIPKSGPYIDDST
jgi:hypothetical protein